MLRRIFGSYRIGSQRDGTACGGEHSFDAVPVLVCPEVAGRGAFGWPSVE